MTYLHGRHKIPELGYILLDTFAYTFLKLIFKGHNGFEKFQTYQNMMKPRVKASAPLKGKGKCHFLLQKIRFEKVYAICWYSRVYNPALKKRIYVQSAKNPKFFYSLITYCCDLTKLTFCICIVLDRHCNLQCNYVF